MHFCILLLFLSTISFNVSLAERCQHSQVMEKLFTEIPDFRVQILQKSHEALLHARSISHEKNLLMDNTPLSIPIVWHVLYASEGHATQISREIIEQEMQWLNDWYSAQNIHYENENDYFANDIATREDFEVTFVLADEDNDGNAFDGIHYYQTNIATNCNENNIFFDDQGGVDIWDTSSFVNMYTCSIDGGGSYLGFAYLPGTTSHSRDGIVLNYAELGSAEYSGSTIAHEVGHHLGLYHTFDNGCDPGDYIDDTPPLDAPSSDWANSIGYCPSESQLPAEVYHICSDEEIVMTENCMDYNIEPCLSYFSKGQAERIRYYLTNDGSIRKPLTSSHALPGLCEHADCTDKECGDDGCGGSCGECETGVCNNFGICEIIAPSNVECDTAESFTTIVSANIEESTTPFFGCDRNFYKPLWYTFTPNTSASYTFSTDNPGTQYDTYLGLFSDCDYTCITSNDDYFPFQYSLYSSRITVSLQSGITYYLAVDGFSGASGLFELSVILDGTEPFCIPNCDGKECGSDGCDGSCGFCMENEICAQNICEIIEIDYNDECLSATTIEESMISQNNIAANVDLSSCADLFLGVWYKFNGNGQSVTFSTCTNNFDTVIHVFEGICDSLLCLGTNDDSCGLGSEITICTEADVNYYIVVDGYNGRKGFFDLEVTLGETCALISMKSEKQYSTHYDDEKIKKEIIRYDFTSIGVRQILASNEECSNSINIDSLGFPAQITQIVDRTDDVISPISFGCIVSNAPGVWYSFTGTGNMVRVDTCAPTVDPYNSIIQIMSGSCENLECIAYATPETSRLCNSGSNIVICTTLNENYWILVEGQGGQTGEFVLSVEETGLSCNQPTNTECNTSQTLTVGNSITIAHKDYRPSHVTKCEQLNTPDGGNIFSNVAWFYFNAPNDNTYSIDLCSNRIGNFEIEIFQGNCNYLYCFGSKTVSSTCNGQDVIQFCATSGEDYYIAIYGDYGRYDIIIEDIGNDCLVPCIPLCNGVCGSDTCGGTCGACGFGLTCTETFQCDCVPDCDGKFCGDDGCGGSCGSCSDGELCNTSNQCVCAPSCAGKECGSDGCGGSCGTCRASETCSSSNQCVCTPDCEGKECGSNGCGGFCGSCGNGNCVNDLCEFIGCDRDCNDKLCGDDGCGGSCGSCSSSQFCNSEQICECQPSCNGKQCGEDGCGGFCGSCSSSQFCNSEQLCECQPNCFGKQCGDDGCGGSCGGCATNQVCLDSLCTFDPNSASPTKVPTATFTKSVGFTPSVTRTPAPTDANQPDESLQTEYASYSIHDFLTSTLFSPYEESTSSASNLTCMFSILLLALQLLC